jgi:hypothetical protein
MVPFLQVQFQKPSMEVIRMVKENDEFETGGRWYLVTGVFPATNMVQTIDHPTLNRFPNVTGYTYWSIKQVEELIDH